MLWLRIIYQLFFLLLSIDIIVVSWLKNFFLIIILGYIQELVLLIGCALFRVHNTFGQGCAGHTQSQWCTVNTVFGVHIGTTVVHKICVTKFFTVHGCTACAGRATVNGND